LIGEICHRLQYTRPKPKEQVVLRKFLAFFVVFVAPVSATTVTILTFNDVYEVTPKDGWGGLAEMQTLLERERADADFSITTVNGDFLAPSQLSSVTRGAHMVALFNQLGVDMVVHGNHEFDFGPDVLTQRMGEREFLWFGTNVLDANGFPFGGADAASLCDVDGITIGFFGLCTADSANISNPGPTITFQPVLECAREACAALKAQGADVIIVLTHQTIFEDMELAEQVPQIDLILAGHEHQVITFQRSTLIHKSGYDARYLGRLDLEIEKEGDEVTIIPRWRMIPNYQTPPDPIVKARIDAYEALLDTQLGVVLGHTVTEIDGRRLKRYSGETSLGNLVADALRHETGADIALLNSAFICGDQIVPVGTPITRGMVVSTLPYANMAMTVEVTGEQLLAILRHGLSAPGQPARFFPQISGLRVVHRDGEPLAVHVGDQLLDSTATYTLAITDYLYRGGDGYGMLTDLPIVEHPSADNTVDSLLTRYLTALGDISAPTPNRIIATL
jgi:5'-nucleotidase / UDP-sugar diphosphatase